GRFCPCPVQQDETNLHWFQHMVSTHTFMKWNIFVSSLLASLSLALPGKLLSAEAPASPGYHFLKEIAIGGEGGWDYLAVNETARRLYVTHDMKVVVVDLNTDKVVGEIADTPGVHGIAIAALSPEMQLGFTSNGREDKMSMVDLKTLKTTTKIATGKRP